MDYYPHIIIVIGIITRKKERIEIYPCIVPWIITHIEESRCVDFYPHEITSVVEWLTLLVLWKMAKSFYAQVVPKLYLGSRIYIVFSCKKVRHNFVYRMCWTILSAV